MYCRSIADNFYLECTGEERINHTGYPQRISAYVFTNGRQDLLHLFNDNGK